MVSNLSQFQALQYTGVTPDKEVISKNSAWNYYYYFYTILK